MSERSRNSPQFLEYLQRKEILSRGEVNAAENVLKQSGTSVDVVLARLGLLSEAELADSVANYLGMRRAEANGFSGSAAGIYGMNVGFLLANRVLPGFRSDGTVELAISNPADDFSKRAIEFVSQSPVVCAVATLGDIESGIAALYGSSSFEEREPDASPQLESLHDLVSDAPVVRLVQRLVTQAIDQKASDIHIEPIEIGVAVRYRIDGLLRESEVLPAQLKDAVASRLKVMAHLNIAEKRLPQDGRIRLTVHGKDIDFRVATSPTLHGESIVLRVLDRREVALDFSALGFDQGSLPKIRGTLAQPHGVFLVTGPTGSGKTTTLYAALKELNSPDRKILTAEDPIEYTLDRVNQTQVRPQIGHDFAQALRSFLRQDPDVIMVGEIRDAETARIATQAALTGHLLLSTLHTNSAASAVTRLLDMGIEDYLLASTLTLVIGQRLVRRLCDKCRESYSAPEALLSRFNAAPGNGERAHTVYRAKGCANCQGTGYSGRLAIAEVMEVNEEIQRLILAKSDAGSIERCAVAAGMKTINQDGLGKVLAGLTTIEEVLRVTQNV